MFTTPRLNAIHTIARFLWGRYPSHGEMVAVYHSILKRK